MFAAVGALTMLACSENGGEDVGQGDAAASVCEQEGVLAGHGVRVCAHRKVGPTPPPVDVELSGPVLAAGNMSEQSPCANSAYDTQGFWFEAMHPSGELWVFGGLLPGVGNPLKEGDMVSVKASVDGLGYPRRASLVLRDSSDELIAYVGEAGDTAELTPPDGIAVSRGKAVCTKQDSCGDWSAYDLDVTVAGKTTSVAYATLQDAGPYRVAHGGCELQASANTTCPDWSVGRVAVGITPAP